MLTPINKISHSKKALILYGRDLRLNLAQCVCMGYMGSWILSSTSKIMNSWYHCCIMSIRSINLVTGFYYQIICTISPSSFLCLGTVTSSTWWCPAQKRSVQTCKFLSLCCHNYWTKQLIDDLSIHQQPLHYPFQLLLGIFLDDDLATYLNLKHICTTQGLVWYTAFSRCS